MPPYIYIYTHRHTVWEWKRGRERQTCDKHAPIKMNRTRHNSSTICQPAKKERKKEPFAFFFLSPSSSLSCFLSLKRTDWFSLFSPQRSCCSFCFFSPSHSSVAAAMQSEMVMRWRCWEWFTLTITTPRMTTMGTNNNTWSNRFSITFWAWSPLILPPPMSGCRSRRRRPLPPVHVAPSPPPLTPLPVSLTTRNPTPFASTFLNKSTSSLRF